MGIALQARSRAGAASTRSPSTATPAATGRTRPRSASCWACAPASRRRATPSPTSGCGAAPTSATPRRRPPSPTDCPPPACPAACERDSAISYDYALSTSNPLRDERDGPNCLVNVSTNCPSTQWRKSKTAPLPTNTLYSTSDLWQDRRD